VFGLALRRLGDRGRAETRCRDVRFDLALCRLVPTGSRPRGVWLYAVARNAIVDRPAHAARFRPTSRTSRLTTRPGDRAEQGWVAWRVHCALEELPEREREVLALAYWSGLSQSEVAEFLGIPLGTVKTRTRARSRSCRTFLERV
jgi:RNA polymerase sigma-70 factor (ECF subfamily)